ncbi:hypothetical protein [uncultured Parolsenella sp.]|nr:hypothetical protein [uncultured Parolsenella sp.]
MEELVAMPGACLVSHNEGRIEEPLGWMIPSDYRGSIGLAA